MAGAAAPEAGLYTNIAVGRGGVAPSSNSNRFSSAIDRIFAISLRSKSDYVELMNLCIYLSRTIDIAIWNHEVPSRSQELPVLIKQLYQNRNDNHLLAATMVLMISVKSACQNGWFSDGDSKVLSYLAKEIASNFCCVSDFVIESSSSFSVISTIISRFLPKIKIGHIFVSLEVKPGFDAYVSDFHISNDLKPSPGDIVRLFVVQTDSIETSSCLVTPPKVEFLLNGKGVDNRSDPFVDTGPQLPTNLSKMLKYGPNLLQAVGEFNGNYIIVVASTNGLPCPDSNTLQDYEQCAPANVDADSDIIEGSSRISLNCPISKSRIKIPVKGHSCKHIQCFDFENYVDINSRRPSWRCPHCLQHACFPDIRIDQIMVKVLQEVGPNACDVMFCSDGSWNAVTESEEAIHNSEDNTGQNKSQQPAAVDVLDLTQTDDAMDTLPTGKRSPSGQETQNSNTNSGFSDYWAGLFMSTFELGPSNAVPNESTPGVSLTSSSFTPDRLVEALNHQSGYPSMSNERGRFPLIPGHMNTTPNAAAQTPNALQWGCANAASQTSPTVPNLSATRATPRQQNFAFPPAQPAPHQNAGFQDPNQVPNMYRVSNASSSSSSSSSQQMGNLRFNRAMSQPPAGMIQPSSSFSRPQSVQRMGGQQSLLIAEANRVAQMSIDATRTNPSWNPPDGRGFMPTPLGGDQRSMNGAAPSQPVNYDLADPSSWRPNARMRGALVGQAYDDFLYQNVARPPQLQPAVRPSLNVPPQAMFGQFMGSSGTGMY